MLTIGYEYNKSDPWINGWPYEEEKVNQIIADLRKVEQINRLGGNVHTKEQFKKSTFCENSAVKAKYIPFCAGPFIIDLVRFDENGIAPDIAQLKWVHDIKDEVYVFPITVYGFVFLTIEYFKTHGIYLSEKVKDDCRRGLCKVFLHEFYEGTPENIFVVTEFIKQQAKILDIPESSFIYADSNLINLQELKKVGSVVGFSKLWWESFMQHLPSDVLEQRISELREVPEKPYHFISLNRRIRPHRVDITKEIFKRWNDKCVWTFTGESPDFGIERETILRPPADETIEEYINSLPKLLDIDLTGYSQHHKYTELNFDIQNSAYINIVTETYFYETSTAFLSEKVFKPITALQPFIVLGPHHTLKRLKDFGYKTFNPFIDESYDDIENPHERFNAIVNEIDRLSKYTITDMKELISQCAENCIHNYFNLTNANGNLIRDKQFVAEIKHWMNNV